jgi:hypothetical protein
MTRDEWLLTLPKGMVCVELGVFLGDFSSLIYENCKPSWLYLVDIFPDSMMSGDKDGMNVKTADLRSIPDSLRKKFENKNISVHKQTTTDFLKSSDNQDIDFVYIDAEHSYKMVKSDLEESYRRVKPGGIIAGHDYCRNQFPGVCIAVDEFCKEKNLELYFLSKDKLPTFAIRKV